MSSIKPLLLFAACFFYLPIRVTAQPLTPEDNGLKEFKITDPSLGIIRFYLDTTNLHKRLPLFFEVNGSGGLPLCIYMIG